MAASAAFGEWMAELAGPVVVKEVRQGLRARIFAVFFGLLLVACLVTALVAAAESDRRVLSELGPEYFRLFLAALAVVEFFVIPYSAFRATVREREDETWVLLVLTGLGARRIVRGKVASALAQGLLYASACAPFVLFSYYLNGIALITVLVALALAASWSCLLVCLGVAAGTAAKSRLGNALMHFLVLGVLFGATAGGIAFGGLFSVEGGRLLSHEIGFRAFCAAMAGWSLTTAWVAAEGAAAGLSLQSENAARGPRLALGVQVGLGLTATVAEVWLNPAQAAGLAAIGSLFTTAQLAVVGLFAGSQADGCPPAFMRERAWFKPGALRSVALLFVLLALCTATWAVLYGLSGARDDRLGSCVLVPPLLLVLYLSAGIVLGRLSPLRKWREPVATRAGFGLALAVGIGAPMFFARLFGHRAGDRHFNVLNPAYAASKILSRHGEALHDTLVLSAAGALLLGFVAFTVLTARDGARRA